MWNGAELHLFVNHLPVIGFLGVTLGLLIALVWPSADVKRFMLAATVVTGLSGGLPFATGEGAEDAVEPLAGVAERYIHSHEEAAEQATVLGFVTAGVAFVVLVVARRRPEVLKIGVGVTLACSLVSAAMMGRAAHEGGKIRHPEIVSASATLPANTGEQEHDDD
jgi:hypothetical protein